MSGLSEAILARLETVRTRVADAARTVGRDPADVRVIGITKEHPTQVAEAAYACGITDLGENRVADLLAKRAAVPDARWHLVGQLQRNKVRDVVDGLTLVHSVDRTALVDRLAARATALGVVQPILVQVNVGDDPAKGGCRVDEVGHLVAYAHRHASLRTLGLMTVPPLPEGDDPVAAARPHFAALRDLRDEVQGHFPEVRELSMGMTADLEAAVAEGATMVRVGTALFGPRPVDGRASREEAR